MPRRGTIHRSGVHLVCVRPFSSYPICSLYHSAEFCPFGAVYPGLWPHPSPRGDAFSAYFNTPRRFYILMRRTTISHFSFKRNFQTQSKDSMPTSQGNTDPIIARSDQHSPSPDPKRRCEITIISFSRSICREELAALIGVTGKPYPRCLSCHSHPIRPCGAPSPRG